MVFKLTFRDRMIISVFLKFPCLECTWIHLKPFTFTFFKFHLSRLLTILIKHWHWQHIEMSDRYVRISAFLERWCYNQHSNIVHCPLSLSHLTGRKANKQCNPKNGISFPQGPSHHRWSKRTLGCHFNLYQLLSIKFSKSTSPHRRSRRARVVVRNHINY